MRPLAALPAKLFGTKANRLSRKAKNRLGQALQLRGEDMTYRLLLKMRLETSWGYWRAVTCDTR